MTWQLGPAPAAPRPSRGWLTFLERIGQDVLVGDVHFAPEALWRPPRAYVAWSTGGRGGGPPPAVPAGRRATGPSVLTPLWPMLACHRHLFGPVGLYWLVPMMFLLVVAADQTPELVMVEVACPSAPPAAHVVLARALCPGLPAGCEVRFHHWKRRSWASHRALVAFVGFYQCHVLAGELGSWQRLHGSRGDAYFPLDAALDDLLLVTAGGVPVASAGLQSEEGDAAWYISALCAATRSTAGSLAIEHLKTHGRILRAEATADAVGFYTRHGFCVLPCTATGGGMYQWVPPAATSSPPPTKRQRVCDTDGT